MGEKYVIVKTEAAGDIIRDIYAAAVAVLPASDIGHYATDLYIRVTRASIGLVQRYRFRNLVTTFKAADGSGMWYDVPFAYTPEWERHARETEQIRKMEELQSYNSMCHDCLLFGKNCKGTKEKVWSGCVRKVANRENWKICGGNCTECASCGIGCWELKPGETIAFYQH